MNGTQVYYNYLDQNDRGLQRIGVYSITRLPKAIFQLKINGNLFDTEAIFFRLKTNDKRLNTTDIKVVSYDKIGKTLLLRPEEAYLSLFEKLNATDLEIISDLKFLVERIRIWYEKNGGKIQFPSNYSKLKGSVSQICFFEDMQPSINQRKAIQTIFDAPLSYIWGAPGTGKTQGVLSYALLHYLKNGYKVAILGPTNNAIEQVLRGVVAMTDQAEIDRTKILRLGTPSKNFADQFPEVCEARGILKQLEDLEYQIKILEKVLLYKQYQTLLKILEEDKNSFETLRVIKEKLDRLAIRERQFLISINANKRKIERRQKKLQKLNNTIRSINRKLAFLETNPIRTAAKDIPLLEKEKKQLQDEYQAIEDELDDFLANNEFTIDDWQIASEKLKEQAAVLEKKIAFIKTFFEKNNAQNPLKKLLSGRAELVETAIQEINSAYEKNKIELGALAAYYESYAFEELEHQKATLLQQQNKLRQYSTEERLKNVSIISATLDGYIGRFMDEKLPVHHIFVDEAGYANLVKVLTLFNHQVPITLLGDHKQLPPVCEISDQTISRDATYYDAFVWAQSAIFVEGTFFKKKEELLLEYVQNTPLELTKMQKADLNQTYRFGANLAEVLNEYVYKNGFQSAHPKGKTAVYYINAPKPLEAKKKRENSTEAQQILNLIEQLDHNDFVVLTPYRNQLKLLGNLLPSAKKNQQLITVHASQGREWHTVILSLVDSYDMWFTDSKNKISKGLNLINTAVSRAKKELIIVGDISFWKRQEGQLLKGLLNISNPF